MGCMQLPLGGFETGKKATGTSLCLTPLTPDNPIFCVKEDDLFHVDVFALVDSSVKIPDSCLQHSHCDSFVQLSIWMSLWGGHDQQCLK